MDLQTPPPSYESATGAPGVHNQKNQFFNGQPSAPPPSQQDDEIISESITTTPILPQSYYNPRPTQQHVRPYNENARQLVIQTPDQTNQTLRQKKSNSDLKSKCFFVGTIAIILIMVVVIGVTTKSTGWGNKNKKFDYSQINLPVSTVNNEWEEKWWKDNQKFIDKLQKQSEMLNNYNFNLYKPNT